MNQELKATCIKLSSLMETDYLMAFLLGLGRRELCLLASSFKRENADRREMVSDSLQGEAPEGREKLGEHAHMIKVLMAPHVSVSS